MSNPVLDVAVVGGGVSGVYSAWRILTESSNQHRKITVFEGNNHIGGRLLSLNVPGIHNMVAEVGGMRILPKVQPLIWNLIQALNRGDRGAHEQEIELYDFPVDQDENISYLRGTHLRLCDFTQRPRLVPYRLTFQEFGQTSGQILVHAIEQIVPGITAGNLTEQQRREMAQNGSFAGEPLYLQGFWNVLSRIISGEAYQFGVDAGGYQTTLSNWNAADAIPWFLSDFGVDPKYQGFRHGFQQVPLTVARRFEKAGGKIEMRRVLTGFDWDGKHFHLKFEHGPSVQAKKLILAMPRRSLDLLMPQSPLLERIKDLIAGVTPRPLFKLFTTYDSPWWRMAGVNLKNKQTGKIQFVPLQKGRTTTDLPLRQTYYWVHGNGEPVVSGPGMLMACYDDGSNIGYWDGLRFKRGLGWSARVAAMETATGLKAAFTGTPPGGESSSAVWREWAKYPATQGMVQEIQRQLMLVHGLSFIPHAVNACYKDWGDDPFGGGWNSWNIGVKSWKIKKEIVHPGRNDGVPLFICGEAYSDAQGWVEGALQTADLVLKEFEIGALPSAPLPE